MATPHTILVVGATGNQGSATIAALTALPIQTTPLHILALTRSISSQKAQTLQKTHPAITLVEGDVCNPTPILSSHPTITSIFLVTTPPADEAQAIPLINAAIAAGIPHIVFSSADRGGETRSWETPTPIPHFAAKQRIELHLRDVCVGTSTSWTVLRPVGFMDNYAPGAFGSMMAGLWSTMAADRKMALVSVADIGRVAASAIVEPERWKGRAVGIAGDELTFAEANAVFREVVGYDMPRTWALVSWGVRWSVEDARKSMRWFEDVGFGVDGSVLRAEGFEVQSFEDWVRGSGHWTVKS
ncbi:nucleoside-diphosphate-sugar epimerase family protein [Massariosphaeria phaeospora]|uniref:Nucleoside-diphosphate-sugar epimerase family protein n=1 Tax=Massariosphaeria phaeospora TaxID=100035 RepID=A0A7C8M4M1_9PLEO|nr:nucleoside-diphosphate-sugar epimerase family protein [Massariosphaeria phaeospora]